MQPKAWESTGRETWTQAMKASVLTFSDTQLITGAAILLCGYTQLADGLSSYHWEMVVCLAWFSSLTHLATLSSLRGYFLDWPHMAVCRAGLMGAVLISLAVSCGTTGYMSQFGTFSQQSSWPARCLFSPASMRKVGAADIATNNGKRPLFNKPFIVLSIVFLLLSYLTRVVGIFHYTANPAKTWFKDIPLKWLRRGYISSASKVRSRRRTARNAFWKARSFLQALVYIVCKALFDIGGSMLWEVCKSSFN